MRCPNCGLTSINHQFEERVVSVVKTILNDFDANENVIYRTKFCKDCKQRFITKEVIICQNIYKNLNLNDNEN